MGSEAPGTEEPGTFLSKAARAERPWLSREPMEGSLLTLEGFAVPFRSP